MAKDIFLELAEAKSRLFWATDREIASRGLGSLAAKFMLRLAERRFYNLQELCDRRMPEEIPIPGTIIDTVAADGILPFGLGQNDDSAQEFGVPEKQIV